MVISGSGKDIGAVTISENGELAYAGGFGGCVRSRKGMVFR
jgi:hypothetical protein